MQPPRVRGLLAASLAVATTVTVGSFPRPFAREPVAAAAAAAEPGPAGLVDAVEDRIHLRMPELGPFDRRRLARVIVGEAEEARIDPLLILALIEVESSYDADARSGAGAVGLMQLQEPTIRRELDRAGLAPVDADDPVSNVRAGVRYLRRLLDAYPRPDVALMAYNAGPNRILGYLRQGGIPERFRAYPRRVQTELQRLRRDFRQGPPPAELAQARRAALAE